MLKPIRFSEMTDILNLIKTLKGITSEANQWDRELLVLPNNETYLRCEIQDKSLEEILSDIYEYTREEGMKARKTSDDASALGVMSNMVEYTLSLQYSNVKLEEWLSSNEVVFNKTLAEALRTYAKLNKNAFFQPSSNQLKTVWPFPTPQATLDY